MRAQGFRHRFLAASAALSADRDREPEGYCTLAEAVELSGLSQGVADACADFLVEDGLLARSSGGGQTWVAPTTEGLYALFLGVEVPQAWIKSRRWWQL